MLNDILSGAIKLVAIAILASVVVYLALVVYYLIEDVIHHWRWRK